MLVDRTKTVFPANQRRRNVRTTNKKTVRISSLGAECIDYLTYLRSTLLTSRANHFLRNYLGYTFHKRGDVSIVRACTSVLRVRYYWTFTNRKRRDAGQTVQRKHALVAAITDDGRTKQYLRRAAGLGKKVCTRAIRKCAAAIFDRRTTARTSLDRFELSKLYGETKPDCRSRSKGGGRSSVSRHDSSSRPDTVGRVFKNITEIQNSKFSKKIFVRLHYRCLLQSSPPLEDITRSLQRFFQSTRHTYARYSTGRRFRQNPLRVNGGGTRSFVLRPVRRRLRFPSRGHSGLPVTVRITVRPG